WRSLGDEEGEDDGGRTRGEEEHVRAQEPRLEPPDETTRRERRVTDVGAGLQDDGLLEVAPQEVGDLDGGLVEDPVVEPVEVELVLEYSPDGRNRGNRDPPLGVDGPGDRDAGEADERAHDGRERLLRGTRHGVRDRRGARRQPAGDWLPVRRELDPAPDGREHREGRDRDEPRPRALAAAVGVGGRAYQRGRPR